MVGTLALCPPYGFLQTSWRVACSNLTLVIPGRAKARARNPYSRSWLWIPGAALTGCPGMTGCGDGADGFNFQTAKTVLMSSLRANGSRECAPDDRLREAIHIWRYELESWIASLRSQ